jgi:hypothetical protein
VNTALVFQIASSAAMVGWLLLAAGAVLDVAAWRHRLLLGGGRVVPLLLCALYLALLIHYWGSAPKGSFATLEGVARLFESRGKLLGGWVHFLAFDLFIGRWTIDDVLASKRSRWLLLPTLPLTFLYGPAGLLLYFLMRPWRARASLPKEGP